MLIKSAVNGGIRSGLNLALLHLIHKGRIKIWISGYLLPVHRLLPPVLAPAPMRENHQGSPWELFTKIRAIGIHYENTLLRATQQVNTQRGILFSGTVLATAAGWLSGRGETLSYNALSQCVAELCRDLCRRDFAALAERPAQTHGEEIVCRIRHYRRARRGRARFPTSLPDWLTRAASGAGQQAGGGEALIQYVAHLNGPLR